MKTMRRRIERALEKVDLIAPVRNVVTRDNVEWVRSLGCEPRVTEEEIGKLDQGNWIVRFTNAELDKMIEAGGDDFQPTAPRKQT